MDLDLLIIGAGPAGLSAADAAAREGLSYVVIEKGTIANTIRQYPVGRTLFSTTNELEMREGALKPVREKPTREELLSHYIHFVLDQDLRINAGEEVIDIERAESDEFVVHTKSQDVIGRATSATYRARRLLFAIGAMDHPRRLNVPGGDLPKAWGKLDGWTAPAHYAMSPEIVDDPDLQKILWAHSDSGFESALEQVQKDFADDPQSAVSRSRLGAMQSAVGRMFQDMNAAFYHELEFEFHNNYEGTVRQFLARFDAIFTLNQDILLEHHYKDQYDISLKTPRQWDSIQIPGMKRMPVDEPMFDKSWARAQFRSHHYI